MDFRVNNIIQPKMKHVKKDRIIVRAVQQENKRCKSQYIRKNTKVFSVNKQYMTQISFKMRQKQHIKTKSLKLQESLNPFLKYDDNFIKIQHKRLHASLKPTNNIKRHSQYHGCKQQNSSRINQKWSITLDRYINAKQSMLKYLKQSKNATFKFQSCELDRLHSINYRKRLQQQLSKSPKQEKQLTLKKNIFVSNLIKKKQKLQNRKYKSKKEVYKFFEDTPQQINDIKSQSFRPKLQQQQSRNQTILSNFVKTYFKRKRYLSNKFSMDSRYYLSTEPDQYLTSSQFQPY